MFKNSAVSGVESRLYKKKLWRRSFFYIIGVPLVVLLIGFLVLGVSMVYVYHGKQFPAPPEVSGIQPYLKNGDIILLDYKTDRVEKAEELIKRYHAQLDYYQQALEQITGGKVKARFIYSFALQAEIEV